MQLTEKVKVGSVEIGGGAPISVQSMTNTHTSNVDATVSQINALTNAGCDIVRLAVTDDDDISASKEILKCVKVPLVADIQFDWKLAAKCSEIGFSKVRFNPGNVGSEANVSKLAEICKANRTPIRVGANLGSLSKDILVKYGRTPEALCESALCHVAVLEKFGFHDIVISVKASDVKTCIDAYRLVSSKCNYPLHLGVTESGAKDAGIVKSAMGIGTLLSEGIGDTVRVSLTGNPVREVEVANEILKALRLKEGYEIISCPTCSRCSVNLEEIRDEVESMLKKMGKPLKVAVMGCVVNGPGEAADADFGVAGGKEKSVIFRKGKVLKTVDNSMILSELKLLADELMK